ncbi:MAG TPA: LytS/YhcK type 5TM receptor domain-containing protein [Methylomirabilota bacterium]|nr:LytS/YhcK type 5TM receptor domain-containing protein [Methylomirabilota bacterium]
MLARLSCAIKERDIDVHDLTEAVGVLALGVIFYSASVRTLARPSLRLPRGLLNGLAFGLIALWLARARIQVAPDVYFDARNVPIALIALFEGWPAGVVAALPVAIYRWFWLGGVGTVPGIVSVACAAAAGTLVRWWALRHGRVSGAHAFGLGALTFLTTLLGYAMLGAPGLAKFVRTWPHFLVAYVGGIGVLATLFQNVLERERLYVAERRFRLLLDESSEAIRIVNADTQRILETNRADCELCGRPRERLLGHDARELWPRDAEGRARWEAVAAEIAARGAASGFGLSLPVAGRPRTVDLTCRRVEHDGRRYDIMIFRDAAPREALDAARREVTDLRAITLVANAAAHEINNPLTVIVGSLELLQRRLDAAGQETKWIDRAIDASQRVREIIGRMTRITKVEPSSAFPGVPAMLDIERSSEDNARDTDR